METPMCQSAMLSNNMKWQDQNATANRMFTFNKRIGIKNPYVQQINNTKLCIYRSCSLWISLNEPTDLTEHDGG